MKVQEFTIAVVLPLKPDGSTHDDYEFLSHVSNLANLKPHPQIALLKTEVREAYVSESFDFDMQSSLGEEAFENLGDGEEGLKKYLEMSRDFALSKLAKSNEGVDETPPLS